MRVDSISFKEGKIPTYEKLINKRARVTRKIKTFSRLFPSSSSSAGSNIIN